MWTPNETDKIYYFNVTTRVSEMECKCDPSRHYSDGWVEHMLSDNLIFKTKELAQEALDKIIQILREAKHE